MESREFWQKLDHFRSSKWGVALYYGYLIGVGIAGVIAVIAIVNSHNLAVKANTAAMQSHRALCLQKQIIGGQVAGGRRFLLAHPGGTPEFPLRLVLRALHNEEVNLAALRDVHCP